MTTTKPTSPVSTMLKNFLPLFLLTFFMGAALQTSQAQGIPTNGLLAYYPLNGNASDVSGNGKNGVINGSLTLTPNQAGMPNGAMRFPNGYITVTPTPFNVNGNWTISTWCKIDSGNTGANDLLSTGLGNSGGVKNDWYGAQYGGPYWQLIEGHQYGVDGVGSGNLLATATNSPYSWNMLTTTKNGNTLEIYLNTTLLNSSTNGATAFDQGYLAIGRGDFSFSGSMNEMLIYNRVLSTNEIAQIYTYESTAVGPAITTNVSNTSALIGSNVTFQVAASGTAPLTYQWYWTNNNPAQFAQAYPQTASGFVFGAVVTNGGFGYGNVPHVTFVGGGGSGASGYGVISNGMVTSIVVTNAGGGYSNSLPAAVIDPPNGILIGQTNSSLNITNLNPANSGGYFVVVSNVFNSVTSSVGYATVLYAPTIVSNPKSVNLSLHGSNTLSVSASGTSPLSYQWTFNTTNISGAIATNYSITNFALTNIGNYAAIVSNPYGTVTSTIASVQMLPTLTVPFTGAVNLWGQPTTLSVGAVGSGTLMYQWYFNGVPIAGATSNTYTFPVVQFTNAGLYSVVASNAYGSVSNNAYQLVVNPANVSLGLYAGVIVQGTVGYSYNIQASTDLGNTNSWVTLTNIILTSPVQIWNDNSTDVHAQGNPKRYYRVLAGQ